MEINSDFEILICGAGPSGLFAAITAAQNGKKVAILEKMNKAGIKLLATGGGRCNMTNLVKLPSFIAAFESKEMFVKSALKQFSSNALINFFEKNSLSTNSPNGCQVYPVSGKSIDVVNCLLRVCNELGVKIIVDSPVNQLSISDSIVSGAITEQNQFRSKSVIVAAGGMSYPNSGSDGSGFELAKNAGHSIVKPVPALAGLKILENWPLQCVGLSLESVVVSVERQGAKSVKKRGPLLFTHKGVSGPSILDISGYVSRLLLENDKVPIRIRLLPEITWEEWNAFFIHAQQKMGSKRLRILLSDKLPTRFVNQLMILAKVDIEVRAADVKKEEKSRILDLLSNGITLTVVATDDFSSAMVTSGGIRCDEIDAHTMQSKKVSGLYFCGEVIDIDGPCGGYNLQWAFSSGYVAGWSAASRMM